MPTFEEYITKYMRDNDIEKEDIYSLNLIDKGITDFEGIDDLVNLHFVYLGDVAVENLVDVLRTDFANFMDRDERLFVQANGLFTHLRNIIALLDQEDVQLYRWEEACRDGGDLSEARDFFRLVREQQDLADILPEEYLTADPDEIGDETLCMLNRSLKREYIRIAQKRLSRCNNAETIVDMIDVNELLAYHDLLVITIDGIVYCFNTNDVKFVLESRMNPTTRVPIPDDILRRMRIWYNQAVLARQFDINEYSDDESIESLSMNAILADLFHTIAYPNTEEITRVIEGDVSNLHWILSNYVNYPDIRDKINADTELDEMVNRAMDMYTDPDRDDDIYRKQIVRTLTALTEYPGLTLEEIFNLRIPSVPDDPDDDPDFSVVQRRRDGESAININGMLVNGLTMTITLLETELAEFLRLSQAEQRDLVYRCIQTYAMTKRLLSEYEDSEYEDTDPLISENRNNTFYTNIKDQVVSTWSADFLKSQFEQTIQSIENDAGASLEDIVKRMDMYEYLNLLHTVIEERFNEFRRTDRNRLNERFARLTAPNLSDLY
jgi:hypothetical protein